MNYSFNWLKELSGTKKTAKEVAELLTMKAFEIEEIKPIGAELRGVVVGEILEIEKHPNADKLQVTKVNIGKEILQVVCGAHNISVGDKVPVATVGTVLSGNFEIKEAEIRGVKSFGMLCAEDELGLGTDHSGILLLDKSIEIGTDVNEILGEKDDVIEIKVLPDRGHDAVSHVGMAREIAALEGIEMDYAYDELNLPEKKAENLSIEISSSELCTRYIGAMLTNIKVKQSPQWMKNKLQASGVRPINNVVDVTNYVMLELGQPMHAFDADVIGNKIVVRAAKENEQIKLLDENELELSAGDIVITDSENPIALAGVMGGINSGISNETASIILESANFNPTLIRKTRVKYNLPTDAAMRFEKQLDPNLAEKAMVRAIELLEHVAGAQLEGCVDEYLQKIEPWKIELDLRYVNKLLGENVPQKECEKILSSLGMNVKSKKETLEVEIPTFRIDLKTQEDLIEEIGRIYGYEKIDPIAPMVSIKSATKNEARSFEWQVKNILAGQGFSEVYNYSFYGLRDAGLAQLGSVKHLELETPQNPDQALMRISLIPNLLKNVRENLKNFKQFEIFEMGRVFWPNGDVLPEEKTILTGAIVLEKKSKLEEQKDKRLQSIFFEAKQYVDDLLSRLGIENYYYDTLEMSPIETPLSVWHQSRSATIKVEGIEKPIGFMGEINPFVLANFDIHTRIAMFEFDMEKLMQVARQENKYKALRKYPIVVRDISMVADAKVSVREIESAIKNAGGDLILDVEMFDAMALEDEKSSCAFHISIGADDRTLKGEEIEKVMENVTSKLEKELAVMIKR